MTNTTKSAPIEEEPTQRRLRRKRRKKPKFRRHESWRYKRLKEPWRKPDGIDNKMRKKVKGWPKSVEIGYGSPKSMRGLHPSGYEEIRVHTVEDVSLVDSEKQAIRIDRTVGARKRVEIIARADERGIHILNPRQIREPEVLEAEEETEGEGEAE